MRSALQRVAVEDSALRPDDLHRALETTVFEIWFGVATTGSRFCSGELVTPVDGPGVTGGGP